jgi:hypothetical protein
MKIKIDHVTNSSSVSFCMYGLSMTKIPESVIQKTYESMKDILSPGYTYEKFQNNVDLHMIADIARKTLNTDFEVYIEPYDGEEYIGIAYSDMDDDETKREFESRLDKVFEQLGFDSSECGVVEDSWRDG